MTSVTPPALPEPPPDAAAHSRRVTAHISDALRRAGGRLDFSRFMDLCLYAPGLGYYVAGATKFGAQGDFVTAPESSPLFGRCLARQIAELLTACGGGDVVEFGGGSGRLARDVLGELRQLGTLPDRYLILEPGEELRRRQRATLEAAGSALAERVVWIDRLPDARFRGVFLANEVLDALPIRRFRICEDGPRALAVTLGEAGFAWTRSDSDPALIAGIGAIEARLGHDLPLGYESELSEQVPAWMSSVAERLAVGAVLTIDYGYPRAEYYLAERAAGTLVCHYRHRAHFDPLILAGIQDISASVDFTAVAEAGIGAGLALAGYCSQTWFLFGCGLDDIVSEIEPVGSAAYLEAARQAKVLTLPGEMGERFQVLAMTRGLDLPLRGFRLNDRRDRLGLEAVAAGHC